MNPEKNSQQEESFQKMLPQASLVSQSLKPTNSFIPAGAQIPQRPAAVPQSDLDLTQFEVAPVGNRAFMPSLPNVSQERAMPNYTKATQCYQNAPDPSFWSQTQKTKLIESHADGESADAVESDLADPKDVM